MFSSNNSNYQRPIVVSYYDECLDQDVLRVVKTMRRRAGLPVEETKPSKVTSSTPTIRNGRKREQQIQSLPKYNIEVQTDSPFHKERPLVPSGSITRKFPRKGFRDEFDYVDYEYNDENFLPVTKPTMLKVQKQYSTSLVVPDPDNTTSQKLIRPNAIKIPPTVDTFIAAQVKDPDSPTRHLQKIESRTMATYSDVSSVSSSPSVFHDTTTPTNFQPFSFVCSADIGKNFVTPPKLNKTRWTNPQILASFTEATDNESVGLSILDDEENIDHASFWERIVTRIMGTIIPITDENDDDIDDTVLLTARAKYEEFFSEVASPVSVMLPQETTAITKSLDGNHVTPPTMRQLPTKIRTTLLNDFLDHLLGPTNKDCDDDDDTIAGGSFADELQKSAVPHRHETPVRDTSRPLLKSIDRLLPAKKNNDLVNIQSKSSTINPPIGQKSETFSRRSRSTLHDIVDRIVGRLSSDLRTRSQQSRQHNKYTEEDDDIDEDENDYDDDQEEDNVTNFITEISIPYTTSLVGLSISPNSNDDDDSRTTTALSIGHHHRLRYKKRSQWKKSILRTMALWDSFDDDEEEDDGDDNNNCNTLYSDDSSLFTFEATTVTFD